MRWSFLLPAAMAGLLIASGSTVVAARSWGHHGIGDADLFDDRSFRRTIHDFDRDLDDVFDDAFDQSRHFDRTFRHFDRDFDRGFRHFDRDFDRGFRHFDRDFDRGFRSFDRDTRDLLDDGLFGHRGFGFGRQSDIETLVLLNALGDGGVNNSTLERLLLLEALDGGHGRSDLRLLLLLRSLN